MGSKITLKAVEKTEAVEAKAVVEVPAVETTKAVAPKGLTWLVWWSNQRRFDNVEGSHISGSQALHLSRELEKLDLELDLDCEVDDEVRTRTKVVMDRGDVKPGHLTVAEWKERIEVSFAVARALALVTTADQVSGVLKIAWGKAADSRKRARILEIGIEGIRPTKAVEPEAKAVEPEAKGKAKAKAKAKAQAKPSALPEDEDLALMVEALRLVRAMRAAGM